MTRKIIYSIVGLLMGAFVGLVISALIKVNTIALLILVLVFAFLFTIFGIRLAKILNLREKRSISLEQELKKEDPLVQNRLPVKVFLGWLVFSVLPLNLLIFDSSFVQYLVLYFSILFILIIGVLYTHFSKFSTVSIHFTSLGIVLCIYPFFVMGSFPFSTLSFFFSFALLFSGFFIPFVSLELTWWLYTIGGRTALPSQHRWLESTKVSNNVLSMHGWIYPKPAQSFIIFLSMIGWFLGSIIFPRLSNEIVVIILKLVALFMVFGLSLTLGTYLNKLQVMRV